MGTMGLEEIRELARKLALQNAVKHGGRADARATLGKLLAERGELRPRAKEIAELVKGVVEEVNKMGFEEQMRELGPLGGIEAERKRKEEARALPPLPNADKYPRIVTRFSPNPDCVLHLGSVRAAILSHEYARIYGGKFILRFEDTDPRLKRSSLEFYEAIRSDLRWLGCEWDEEYIQSDRLRIYYDLAEELIERGGAYVCTCDREAFRSLALAGRACPCRDLGPGAHLERWGRMLSGEYGEGDAIVRVKTDLGHPNPAVRDWPALRIIDPEKYPHPRVGSAYRVWPLYNFACGIDDHLMAVTHVIRGKEHYTNMVRQKYMYAHFGWEYPEAIHYGRLKVSGAELSKSKILKAVEAGLVEGFGDPRLPTLAALRRRGILPEALRRLAIEVGPKPVDATISWENLYAQNRKLIDPIANRYFFIPDPVLVRIRRMPGPIEAMLPLHPEFPDRGHRVIRAEPENGTAELLMPKSDICRLGAGAIVRLMGLMNVRILSVWGDGAEAEYEGRSPEPAKRAGVQIIQWLPKRENLKVELVKEDAERLTGVGEVGLSGEPVGAIIQLVRIGFGRIDEKGHMGVRIYLAHA
ncbi:MAG: glutamate--tRNA ligase [Candidatus Bathyarchaeia archaeon]